MRKIITILYSTIVSLVFLSTIGFFTYSLIDEYNHGALRVQKRITSLEQDINGIPSKIMPGTKEFSDILYEKLGNLNDFSSIIVKYNDSLIFIYPTVSSTIYKVPSENKDSKLISSFNKNIKKQNGTISIEAGLYLLRPAIIYNSARLCFLIIMAATIITIIFIIIYNLTENRKTNKKSSKTIEVKQNTVEYIEPENEVNNSIEEQSLENKTIQQTSEIVSATKEEAIESDILSEKHDIESSDDKEKDNLNNNLVFDTDSIQDEEIKPITMNTTNPSGLFSPVTGFGWQSYLEPRLSNELTRATASELDLSFFIIKIPVLLSCNDDLLMNICKSISNNFQFKDLIFEYSDDCFAGLKLNCSVDDAIIFANTVIEELQSLLPAENNNCYIGISSRSIRMVDARTVIHEAQEALNYSVSQTDEPVIAFRVDTTKYRKYVELD